MRVDGLGFGVWGLVSGVWCLGFGVEKAADGESGRYGLRVLLLSLRAKQLAKVLPTKNQAARLSVCFSRSYFCREILGY